jgi:hypothetical protein
VCPIKRAKATLKERPWKVKDGKVEGGRAKMTPRATSKEGTKEDEKKSSGHIGAEGEIELKEGWCIRVLSYRVHFTMRSKN